MGKYSKWLNTELVVFPDLEKPCIKLGYCPYGQLVEEFPLHHHPEYPHKEHGTRLACNLENTKGLMQWGHDCPVHYHAEPLCLCVRKPDPTPVFFPEECKDCDNFEECKEKLGR